LLEDCTDRHAAEHERNDDVDDGVRRNEDDRSGEPPEASRHRGAEDKAPRPVLIARSVERLSQKASAIGETYANNDPERCDPQQEYPRGIDRPKHHRQGRCVDRVGQHDRRRVIERLDLLGAHRWGEIRLVRASRAAFVSDFFVAHKIQACAARPHPAIRHGRPRKRKMSRSEPS
jgi:hypothetical protein